MYVVSYWAATFTGVMRSSSDDTVSADLRPVRVTRGPPAPGRAPDAAWCA